MRWLVFGAGGHAKVVLDLLCAVADADIIGLIDDGVGRAGDLLHGVEVLGPSADTVKIVCATGAEAGAVAIGDNAARERMGNIARAAGLRLPSLCHPAAIISRGAGVGSGAVVMAGAVLQTSCEVGALCIINTRAAVDHDCRIDDYAHIGPGATLTGGVQVGKGAFIGAGAVVIPGKIVGAGATVGAGAVVIGDVPAGATMVGCPAKIIKGKSG